MADAEWHIPVPKWHANPLSGNFDYKHPELQDGEVLLANGPHEWFASCAWESKRQGQRAYTIFGRDITDHKPGGFRPVFISREELERRGGLGKVVKGDPLRNGFQPADL